MICTWHLAPGTWHLAPGTWHLAPGTWHLAPGTWHLAPGCQMANTCCAHLCQTSRTNQPHKVSLFGKFEDAEHAYARTLHFRDAASSRPGICALQQTTAPSSACWSVYTTKQTKQTNQ